MSTTSHEETSENVLKSRRVTNYEAMKQRSKANIPQGYRYYISACKASKKYGLCVTFCIVFIDIVSYQLGLITVSKCKHSFPKQINYVIISSHRYPRLQSFYTPNSPTASSSNLTISSSPSKTFPTTPASLLLLRPLISSSIIPLLFPAFSSNCCGSPAIRATFNP
jgi:hypothetical protein